MENEYRILEDFPDYRVNRYGVVQSSKSGSWAELKQTKRNGYLKVNLCKNGKVYFFGRTYTKKYRSSNLEKRSN